MIGKGLSEDFKELPDDYNLPEGYITWYTSRNKEYILIYKIIAEWIIEKLEIQINVALMFT